MRRAERRGSGMVGRLAALLTGRELMPEGFTGTLAADEGVLADSRVNIERQSLSTRGELGYVVTDVAGELTTELLDKLESLPETVRLRVLD